jgi:hypothetical protein
MSDDYDGTEDYNERVARDERDAARARRRNKPSVAERLPMTSAESQHYIDTGELPRRRGPRELISLFRRIRAALDAEQTDPQALADLDEDIETTIAELEGLK